MPLVRRARKRQERRGLCRRAERGGTGRIRGRAGPSSLARAPYRGRYDADHDDLTGALSRTAFRSALEGATKDSSVEAPACLLLFDLDGFGVVNKALGHAAGDALLASVGERLRTVSGPRRIVGRLGGDEFAVLARGEEDPAQLIAALLQSLQQFRGERRTLLDLGVPLAQGFYLGRPAKPWPRVQLGEIGLGEPAMTPASTPSLPPTAPESARATVLSPH